MKALLSDETLQHWRPKKPRTCWDLPSRGGLRQQRPQLASLNMSGPSKVEVWFLFEWFILGFHC